MMWNYKTGFVQARSLQRSRGVVLLLTLVLLVILVTVAYRVSGQVAVRRHRVNYLIDYSKARYACDSALKYMLVRLEDLDPILITRSNEPDFSDTFALDDEQYRAFLVAWIKEYESLMDEDAQDNAAVSVEDPCSLLNKDMNAPDTRMALDIDDDVEDLNLEALMEQLPVRGPYGPQWPYVMDPIVLDINAVNIRIEVEDENAKYPIGWMLLDDKEDQDVREAGFASFCEWLTWTYEDIETIREELTAITEIKPFKMEFAPIVITNTAGDNNASGTDARRRARSSRNRARNTRRTTQRTISVAEQTTRQDVDIAQFMNSGLLDIELLARPIRESDVRKESALKYIGLWSDRQVNINTAPRHVLEAALTFGGYNQAPERAEKIIQRRKTEPFKDIEDLKKALFGSADAIKKCEPFITTQSTYFTVRITATSGAAKVSVLMAVSKEGKKVRKLAVISG